MSIRSLFRVSFVGLIAAVTGAMALPSSTDSAALVDALGMRLGAATPASIGPLAFGPENVLFLADRKGATLWAVNVTDTEQAQFTERVVVPDLDQKVAALLGTTRDKLRFADMAVNPKGGALYFSVNRLVDSGSVPAVVRALGPDNLELVNLDKIRYSSAPLPEAPSRDAKSQWGQPQWTMSITDLAFVDGELWVAGLSNEQFASALRRMPFPFGKQGAVTTVEIFHTSHDRWETAAPIEAFLPITLNGVPSILAGYGCSPIATFNRADLKDKTHLRGRTVAELGGGSRPIDMLRYENEGKEWILIANNNRTLMRVDPAEVAKAPALEKGVSHAFEPAGVGYLPIASTGVMHIADLGATGIAVMVRDTESGAVNVVNYSKKWL
jgi:hypothetical protein